MIYLYRLRNTVNGKIYIGQTNNFAQRRRDHRATDRPKTKRYPIYNAIQKYGFDKFEMECLIEFESGEDADAAEIFLIKFLQTQNREFGYNLADGGKVNRGYKHTEEFKKKKSEHMKKLYKIRRVYNAKLTDEQASKIRELYLTAEYSTRQLANLFDIDRVCITKILKNLTYRNDNYTYDKSLHYKISQIVLAKNRPKRQSSNSSS